MFPGLFSINQKKRQQTKCYAESLYSLAVINTRNKNFYKQGSVPDTFDGRYDLLLIHLFIILRLLQIGNLSPRDTQKIKQALFDRLFEDMEQSLREKGVGDVGISKHIKRMMLAFNGRMHAYQDAVLLNDLSEQSVDLHALESVLQRNLYGTLEQLPAQDGMCRMSLFILDNLSDDSPKRIEKIMLGHIVFDNAAFNEAQGQRSLITETKRQL